MKTKAENEPTFAKVSVYVAPEIAEKLRVAAFHAGMSKSKYAALLIEQGLAKTETK